MQSNRARRCQRYRVYFGIPEFSSVSLLIAVLLTAALFPVLIRAGFSESRSSLALNSFIYEGDLVLKENNVTTITGRFDINGSIIVEENATLVLRNAIVNFTQTYGYQHRLVFQNPANGNPRLQVENATISASNYSFYVFFSGNSSAAISNLTTPSKIILKADGSSSVSMSNSTIEERLNVYYSSVVNIQNSTIYGLSSFGGSFVNASDSTIEEVMTWGSSFLNISNCEIKWLTLFSSSIVEVSDSTISVSLHIESSSVNCSISGLKSWLISSWNYHLDCSVVIGPGGFAPNAALENTGVNTWDFVFYESSNVTIYNSTRINRLDSYEYTIVDVLSSQIGGALSASGHSLVNVSNSTISWVESYGSSQVNILNSTITDIYSYVSSQVNALNSTITNVYTYDSSQTNILNSTISYLESHCVVNISDSTIDEVHTYDTSTLTVLKSTISYPGLHAYNSSTASISESTVSYLTTHHSSTVSVSKCALQSLNLHAYNASTVNLNNSTIYRGFLYTYGSSVVNLNNSTFTTTLLMQLVLRLYDSSIINLNNSTISMGIMLAFDSSAVNLCNSTVTWQLTAYDSSTVRASNTVFQGLTLTGYSVARLVNSTYAFCSLQDQSRAYVCWYLDVHVVDSVGQNVPTANVTATYPNATVAEWKLTDANGWTRLTLTEKMMNATGSYPVGIYTVTAEYEVNLGVEWVNMTGNQKITIILPFIVPEFPQTLILPLFLTITLVAIILKGGCKGKKDAHTYLQRQNVKNRPRL